MTSLSISSNVITFEPSEEIKSGTDYWFWVRQSVTNPAANDDINDAFYGESFIYDSTLDSQETLTEEDGYTREEYTILSDAVTELSNLTVSVWPQLQGEKAHYSFEFVPSETIDATQRVFIQFNPNYYD